MITLAEKAKEILEGLEGVTPGPWSIEPHGRTTALYSARDKDWHGLRLMSLDDGDRNFDANAAHIARCDPDTIRALATAALERDDVARTTIDQFNKLANQYLDWQKETADERDAVIVRLDQLENKIATAALENERLKEALEPFAEIGKIVEYYANYSLPTKDDLTFPKRGFRVDEYSPSRMTLELADFTKARAVIAAIKAGLEGE